MNTPKETITSFFDYLDTFIDTTFDSITGQELASVVEDFYKILRFRKGQGAAGGWLSEYLVFAYLCKYFAIDKAGHEISKTTNFEYRGKDGIKIIPNFKLCNITADFVIYQGDISSPTKSIHAAIEIKTSPASIEQLNEYLDRYREIHKNYPGAKILMIIFAGKKEKGKRPAVTEEEKSWLKVKYIGNDPTSFKNVIDFLKLKN